MFRTKKQHKELANTCPIGNAADIIGDSWILLIIRDLLIRPRRFGELEISLAGTSTRTLTKKLQFLESREIVFKKETSDETVCTKYTLTQKGKDLGKVIRAIEAYGKKYVK